MGIIADILMVAGGFGAALYCFVLARRLSRFNNLESGVGGAVAVLSAQVDDLTKALADARKAAAEASVRLEATTSRAEDTARKLELLMASSHAGPGSRASAPSEPDAPEGGHASARTVRRRRRVADEAHGEAA